MAEPIGLNPAQTAQSAPDYINLITTLEDESFVLVPKEDPTNTGKTKYEKITVEKLKAYLKLSLLPNTSATSGELDFVPAITTLSDTSFILVVRQDPNDADEMIYEKITIAHLKTELAPHVWVGDRRQIKASGQHNTTNGIGSVLTNSITPSRSGALIRVRVGLFASLATAPGSNGHIHFFAKRKVGTGDYTGMDGGGDYSQFAAHVDYSQQYTDWVQPGANYEWLFTSANDNTDVIKVNMFVRPRVGTADQSNYVLNRNTNNSLDGEMVSFLEIAEYKKSNSANPITINTISSLDSD